MPYSSLNIRAVFVPLKYSRIIRSFTLRGNPKLLNSISGCRFFLSTYFGIRHLSPLREETAPSFKVDYNQNLWYDFGIGEGGSIIDLVARLEYCSIAEAIEHLKNNSNISIHTYTPISSEPAITILSAEPLADPRLLNYLRERAIDTNIAKHYCREVRYSIGDKEYFAIGFLESHTLIHACLDNDSAGRRTLEAVEKLGVEVVDQSPFHRDFKDLNDYLANKAKVDKQVYVSGVPKRSRGDSELSRWSGKRGLR